MTTEQQAPRTPARIAPVMSIICALTFGTSVLLLWWARGAGWQIGWTCVGVILVNVGISTAAVGLFNPVLIRARARIGVGTATWDYAWMGIFAATILWIIGVVAGDPGVASKVSVLNPVLWLVGAAVHTAGWQLVTACELVNPFFEKTVRIQRERGHRVIDTGPYHYVRHPGYVGFALVLLSLPVLLDFMPVWIPGLAAIAALVGRTAMEDRLLRAELAGYEAYAERTRYRLLPGVW